LAPFSLVPGGELRTLTANLCSCSSLATRCVSPLDSTSMSVSVSSSVTLGASVMTGVMPRPFSSGKGITDLAKGRNNQWKLTVERPAVGLSKRRSQASLHNDFEDRQPTGRARHRAAPFTNCLRTAAPEQSWLLSMQERVGNEAKRLMIKTAAKRNESATWRCETKRNRSFLSTAHHSCRAQVLELRDDDRLGLVEQIVALRCSAQGTVCCVM